MNIARDGAPKRLHNCPIHGGMYTLRNGQMIGGISRTQAAHPLDDSRIVTAPTAEKVLGPVGIKPDQRSRIGTVIGKLPERPE
jgi:hypothetical protein